MTPERIQELRAMSDDEYLAPVDFRNGLEEACDEIERLQADYDAELSKSAALSRVMLEVATELQQRAELISARGLPGSGENISALAHILLNARAAHYPQTETETLRQCAATFGSKRCFMLDGHTCAHTSRSGSMWPIPVETDPPVAPQSAEPERCNAAWEDSEGGDTYRCSDRAGHDGQHMEIGRATWADDAPGAKPHEPEKQDLFYENACDAAFVTDHVHRPCVLRAGHEGDHSAKGGLSWRDDAPSSKRSRSLLAEMTDAKAEIERLTKERDEERLSRDRYRTEIERLARAERWGRK